MHLPGQRIAIPPSWGEIVSEPVRGRIERYLLQLITCKGTKIPPIALIAPIAPMTPMALIAPMAPIALIALIAPIAPMAPMALIALISNL